MQNRKKRYLVLQNGDVFEGYAFGADFETIGELVFTTGMCGYLETLTDPSYYGQIVLQTFPLIGNYGIIPSDFEGNCFVKGYVVREWCDAPSNFRCEGDLDSYLKSVDVPGIYGVDTREITKIIREYGVMNAKICDELPEELSAIEEIKNYMITDAVETVTTKDTLTQKTDDSHKKKLNVVLYDFGAKKNIERELLKRGCNVTVVPGTASSEDVMKLHPDGIMLSNGPGDPADNKFQIEQIRELLGKVPMFGICLGHQLTALAVGGKTEKLKYGHRGVNQPVKEVKGTRTYITSQNHGYAVISDSVTKTGEGELSYINANDGTCEGMDYPKYNAFTVQFHPEACSGPHDTSFLFDRFINMMGGAD